MDNNIKSKNFPDSFYRVTVKAIIVKDDKVLLIKESPKLSGKWELPGGGLDFGEDIHDGLKREIEEEMGLKVKSIEKRPIYAWTWRYENHRNLDWFYSLVLVYRAEFESFEFKPTEECEEIDWFSKEDLENIELDSQINGLKKVFNPKDFI